MERSTELEALIIRPYQAVSAADTDEWWQGRDAASSFARSSMTPTSTPPERRKR